MLDLRQIQSNVLRGYLYGSAPKYVHYTFLRFGSRPSDVADARAFLKQLYPLVTCCEAYDAAKGDEGPAPGVLNIGLAYPAIDLFGYGGQARSLDATDDEATANIEAYKCGMRARAKAYLGDEHANAPEHWETAYREGRLHAVMAMNAPTREALLRITQAVDAALAAHPSVQRVHDEPGAHFSGAWAGKEHFGFADGIAQPSVLDAGDKAYPGAGTPKTKQKGNFKPKGWSRLRSGEFVLGHADELGQVLFQSRFFYNGSFMVFRKLQQHVGRYRDYVKAVADKNGTSAEFVGAKMVGRWPSGAPLLRAPKKDDPKLAANPEKNNDFRYADDKEGARCPLGAHIRRNNPREDPSGPGVVQTKLHRIIRRATPYGRRLGDDAPEDKAERGTLFVVINANIARQFEFVQRNWVNSVLSSTHLTLPADRDPLIGAQHPGGKAGKYLMPSAKRGKGPMIGWDLPSFVTTRGGEYFLLPSLDALYDLANDVPPPADQADCPNLESPAARPEARPAPRQSAQQGSAQQGSAQQGSAQQGSAPELCPAQPDEPEAPEHVIEISPYER